MSFSELSSEDSEVIPLAGCISANRPAASPPKTNYNKNNSDTESEIANIAENSSRSKKVSSQVCRKISNSTSKGEYAMKSDIADNTRDEMTSPTCNMSSKSRSKRKRISLPEMPDEVVHDIDRKRAKKRQSLPAQSAHHTDANSSQSIPSVLPMRFQCPDNYTQLLPTTDADAAYMEDLEDDDVELWLCKVPTDIDVEALNNKSVNLKGSVRITKKRTLDDKYAKTTSLCFEEQNNSQDSGSFVILAPSKEDGHLHPVRKDITGLLTVRDSLLPGPYELPPPRPKVHRELPPGLKQRYIPFGSGSPHQTSSKHKIKKEKKSLHS